MKIFPILFFCSIFSFGKSDQMVSKSEENTTTISSPIRKRLPIFPKNNIKFVVSPHTSYTDKINTETYEGKIGTRKPLMVKMVPISKKTSFQAKIEVTRKPLMKVRTYTVKMISSNQNINEDGRHRKLPSQSKRHFIKADNDIKHSMSRIENEQEKVIINVNNIIDFLSPPEVSESEKFSKEEEKDRNEFIFLENKNGDINNDILDVSEEDFATTTSTLTASKLRRERSSNIIEEENMGTLVSPLRYTGRDTRLTNEIYFKNINQ